MKSMQVISECHVDWNIKGRHHYVGFFALNCLCVLDFMRHLVEQNVVPRWCRSRRGTFYE